MTVEPETASTVRTRTRSRTQALRWEEFTASMVVLAEVLAEDILSLVRVVGRFLVALFRTSRRVGGLLRMQEVRMGVVGVVAAVLIGLLVASLLS
jgi:hypothetical protein